MAKKTKKFESNGLVKLENVDVDLGGIQELVLTTLQKASQPVPLETLTASVSAKIIGSNKDDILSAIVGLVIEGYDIKEITHGKQRMFALVRYISMDEKDMYRIHGEIHTPVLLTSDWHYGSKGFYKMAYNKMMADIKNFNVKDVCIAGDILQGRGVFSTELSELLIPELGEQISGAVSLLNDIEVPIHIISGNHEEKIQGSIYVGLDALKIVSTACDHSKYYGHVANLTLNGDYHYMMLHGDGAITQATSMALERLYRSLANKPNVLHMGHFHQAAYVRLGHKKHGLMSGTLQRTNTWLLQKGYNAKIGWWILKSIDNESIELIERSPVLN